jgi:thiamine-phosphate pyrophosphorylase
MKHIYPKIYHFIDKFKEKDLINLESNIALIYRNYKKKVNLAELIELKKFCKLNNRWLFLSNNIKVAINLDFDGAYIPSFNKSFLHNGYCLKKKFVLIGSAHTLKDIKIKEKQKCKIIFLSPIFKTNKNKNFLDIFRFRSLSSLVSLSTSIIALGGINQKNIKRLYFLKINGFASISFIKKNRPRIKILGRYFNFY